MYVLSIDNKYFALWKKNFRCAYWIYYGWNYTMFEIYLQM